MENHNTPLDKFQQETYEETMQQIIREHFVPKHVAKELKEAGFQHFCLGYYMEESYERNAPITIAASGYSTENKPSTILAPSYHQASRFIEYVMPEISNKSKAIIILETDELPEGNFIVKSRNVPGLVYQIIITTLPFGNEVDKIIIHKYRNTQAFFQKLLLKK